MLYKICSIRNDFETVQMCWIKTDHMQCTGHENLMVWNRVGKTVIPTARWTANLRGHFTITLFRAKIKYNLIYCYKNGFYCVSVQMLSLNCFCEANKCWQQNRISLQCPQHNRITSKHKRISPQHNGVNPQHNWIFSAKWNLKYSKKWCSASPFFTGNNC